MVECKYPTCTNSVGLQDRDDYRDGRYCSIQCEVKDSHVRMDAQHAQRAVQAEHDSEGYF